MRFELPGQNEAAMIVHHCYLVLPWKDQPRSITLRNTAESHCYVTREQIAKGG